VLCDLSASAKPPISSFQQRASHVEERSAEVLQQLHTQLIQLRDTDGKWKSMEALKVELGDWLIGKENELQTLSETPAKLNVAEIEQKVLLFQVHMLSVYIYDYN